VRYNVRGHEIRSENAAKPIERASPYVREWLRSHGPFDTVIDYGCGKLRYAVTLAKLSRRLTVVDSKVQLSRHQPIGGQFTTVKEYVRRWKNVRALSVEELDASSSRAQFVLCANVLSAIPTQAGRVRVVRRIKSHCAGVALFIVQFRNSHFRKWEKLAHAISIARGWLVPRGRGASFYAPLSPDELVEEIVDGGMIPVDAWTNSESVFVLAVPRT
jgi:hypothetical protein